MSTAKTSRQTLQSVSQTAIPPPLVMPHQLELEETILGAILLDKSAFKIASRILNKDCFYKYSHQTVWEACLYLDKKMSPIDIVTVTDSIRKAGLMEKIEEVKADQKLSAAEARKKAKLKKFGITPYEIVEMTNRVASAANLEAHSRILYELYMRREAITEAYEVAQRASDMTIDIFETYDLVSKNFRSKNPQNVLTFKSMNETMSSGAKEPPARRMAGSLLHENSVVIIFSDPGTGKTIFSTQVGDVLSRGKDLFSSKNFYNVTEAKKVILFDFEMEESEMFQRYKKGNANAYLWHKNFYRSGINPSFIDFDDADTLITNEIELVINDQEPDIVIIDNITYISSESSDPKMATKLMKKLLAIQKRSENRLTLIVIAHTPKRDPSLPIELRHLAGAKSLSNFAKTVIAVSKSKVDPAIRYIKQLKCRQDVEQYGEDNVIICSIDKPASGRLEYQFKGYAKEVEHLVVPDIEEQEPIILKDCLRKYNTGKYSWRKLEDYIKTEYGITMSHSTIRRKVKTYAFDELTGVSELKEATSNGAAN